MMQDTYYYRYPRRPIVRRKRWDIASVILGVLALLTSWLVIGFGFGIAAVATGAVARAQATPGTRKPATAAVGIALGVVSILVAVGVLAAVLWAGLEQTISGDPCYPVKQHAGCY
jgi:hypothetical protein